MAITSAGHGQPDTVYIDVEWLHDHSDAPERHVSELDAKDTKLEGAYQRRLGVPPARSRLRILKAVGENARPAGLAGATHNRSPSVG